MILNVLWRFTCSWNFPVSCIISSYCVVPSLSFPLGEWMTGITHFQLRLGWYLACIISFFPQFSIVKSSIKLDWARLSQPVMECSGEITLKGTRPWLSGRLAQALTTQLSPLRSPVTSQGAQLDMWAVLWYFMFKSHPVTFWDNFPNKY